MPARVRTSIGNSLGRNCGPCLITGARLSATTPKLAATTAPALASLDRHAVGPAGPLRRIDEAKLLSRNVSFGQLDGLGFFLDFATLAET